MSREGNSSITWLALILFPIIAEITVSLLIIILYLLAPFYILMLSSSLNNFYLSLFIYTLCAWLYTIYEFLKNGVAIPKSLLQWHIVVAKFVKNNPRKAIAFGLIISMAWYFSQKPEIATNQFDLITSRLNNLEENVTSINSWTIDNQQSLTKLIGEKKQENSNTNSEEAKRFSVPPDSAQLPSEQSEIESLSTSFNNFLSYLSSRKSDTGKISYLMNEKSGALEDSFKQVLAVEGQAQIQCKSASAQEDLVVKCHQISGQIQKLKTTIQSTERNLQDSKQIIEEITRLNTSVVSSDILVQWQKTIEELKGKFQFNAERVNSWLSQTSDVMQDLRRTRSKIQQTNEKLQNKLQDLEGSFSLILKQYEQVSADVSERTKERESHLQLSFKLREFLSLAKKDSFRLEELDKKVQPLKKSVQDYLGLLETESSELYLVTLRQLSGGGYMLSTQARSNPSGKAFVDTILSKKKEIDDLHSEALTFNRETESLIASLRGKGREITGNVGEMESALRNLRSRNHEVIKRLESSILRSNLQVVAVVLVTIVILVMFVRLQAKMRALGKIKDMKTMLIPELIPYIENSSELIGIRFAAVDIIYNEVLSPTQEEIVLMKNKVKDLETSSRASDRKVASKLRRVVDAIDFRSTEQRDL